MENKTKQKIILFLGAGASVPFGKPTTMQMKKILQQNYKDNNFHDNMIQTFLSVKSYQDVEYILKAIEEFHDFSKTYAHDFFTHVAAGGYGHQMIAFGGSGYNYQQVTKTLNEIRNTIQNEVFENYSWNHDDSDTKLLQIYGQIFELLSAYSQKIQVVTTNYDRAIEEFCSNKENNFRYIDGFAYDIDSSRNIWADGKYSYLDSDTTRKNVYLYKLHGSLTWKRHKKYGIERLNYERISEDPNYIQECLIYPTLDPKNGREEEPYKTIRDNFRTIMNDADICIVIGFSFRDTHVNEIFQEFIKKGKILLVIAPHAIKDFRTNVMLEEPEKEDLEKWESSDVERITKSNSAGPNDRKIILIQKKIEVETIDKIVHDIKRELEPEKHPF